MKTSIVSYCPPACVARVSATVSRLTFPRLPAPVRAFVLSRSLARWVERCNKAKRANYAKRFEDLPPVRAFEVTERNAENITLRASKGGKNPLCDAAQRTFERKDIGRAPTYANAVRALSSRIADKHVRQSKMRVEHLRAEFVTEAESAIGEAIAYRIHRFPTLAADLLPRFAIGCLSSATTRALHRVARRACDARSARMAGKSRLVEPSFFNLFADGEADGTSRELTAIWVNARCDELLSLVKARGSHSGNAMRAASAHARLIEDARAFFLASIEGEAAPLPSSGLVRASVPVGFNVAETRHTKTAKQARADASEFFGPSASAFSGERHASKAGEAGGKLVASSSYVVAETRGERLAPSALYKRLLRLADFTGDNGIRAALSRGAVNRETVGSRSTQWRRARLASA